MSILEQLAPFKEQSIICARKIADWTCMNQQPEDEFNPASGASVFTVDKTGHSAISHNWSGAFAVMGLLASAKAFNDKRYENSALHLGRYLKSLQIFSPFLKQHHGAIREITPQTPWCYTRDALSAAWAFIELFRWTGEQEYLDRAVLWAEWFLKNGMDDEGWPLWGVQFEPYFGMQPPQMCNDMHGCFHGGSLNFFYHLYKTTGDERWIGVFFTNIADRFVKYIQQSDGFFRTVEKASKQIPEDYPQSGLHRANDDLGCLGLLCAYKITGKQAYLASIEHFLSAVFNNQCANGHFETSCACIPVLLNIIFEANNLIKFPLKYNDAITRAVRAFLARSVDGCFVPARLGGIDEGDNGFTCARSANYAMIFFLKYFAGQRQYLTSDNREE
jgi:rhamnogalacturonyl hydrolase YesR